MTESSLSRAFLDEANQLLDQALIKIRHCLEQLDPGQVWWRPQADLNSIGNLMLHLAGNLKQWTVTGIRGLDDTRDRESEFAQRDSVPKEQLLEMLEDQVRQARQLFESLADGKLLEPRTIQGFQVTVLGAIMHTTSHFIGHAHQIVYLTRLQLGDRYRFHWSPPADRSQVPM